MDIEELKTTARLAMLELHEDESAELAAIAELAAAVSGMLENFSLMQKVDISGLEPTTHALSEQNSGREDVIVSAESSGKAEGPGKAEGSEKTDNSGKAEAYNLNNPENLIERAPEYDNNHIVIPNVL